MEGLKEPREDCPYPLIFDGSKARIPLCMGGEEHRDCVVCLSPSETEVETLTEKQIEEDRDRHTLGYN